MNYNIAICCISYNRVKSLRRLLKSLSNAYYNRNVTLILSIDKSDTKEVEEFADSYVWLHGEKRVIKHIENLGLRKHILSCGNLLKEFDALIVLEDDLTVSPSFFVFAQHTVEKYYTDVNIAGISLYSWALNSQNLTPFEPIRTDSDVYLMQLAQSWGQVWMKQQWFDFINWYNSSESKFSKSGHLPRSILFWSDKSWLKYHIKYCIEKNKYFVYPYVSQSTDHTEVGEHNKKSNTIFEVGTLRDIKTSYNLAPSIKYDAFYENTEIYSILGLEKDSLCIDLNGTKGNREKKRYWLTLRKMNFKVIKSYGLQFKPIEVNVLDEVPGNDIFLYDTSQKTKKIVIPGGTRYVSFLFNYDGLLSHLKYILKYLFNYKQC